MNIEVALGGVQTERPGSARVARPLLHEIPELQEAHDAFWTALRERVPALAASPRRPLRGSGRDWSRVVLGQVCGYRYATELADEATLIATPRYGVKGADGPFLRSVLLVRAKEPAGGLAELRGRRLAVEAGDLNSLNLLRAEAAPLALGGKFFGPLQSFGGFAAAAEAVAEGEADAALLDGVAFALLGRLRPRLVGQLRVLLWTSRSPGPPLIASRTIDAATAASMAGALGALAVEPAYAELRKALLITGFNPLPKAQYRAVVHLEQIAESQGYPRLA